MTNLIFVRPTNIVFSILTLELYIINNILFKLKFVLVNYDRYRYLSKLKILKMYILFENYKIQHHRTISIVYTYIITMDFLMKFN